MSRARFPNLLLAALLALLLPLEQAHCLWMGFSSHASAPAAGMSPGHECCSTASPAPRDQPSPPTTDPPGCVCAQLPAGTLPAVLAISADAAPSASLAALTAPTLVEPTGIVREPAPALDIGSPPLPYDPGAHHLRAPPVSA